MDDLELLEQIAQKHGKASEVTVAVRKLLNRYPLLRDASREVVERYQGWACGELEWRDVTRAVGILDATLKAL